MNNRQNYYYEFGAYRIDVSNNILLQNNEIVHLSPKLFETLLILIEKNGQMVSKEELFNRLWSQTFVEESNLSQNIFQLRKILKNGDQDLNYIETLPKRGYRFTAKVKKVFTQLHEIVENEKTKDKWEIEKGIERNEKEFRFQNGANYFSKSKLIFATLSCLLLLFCLGAFLFLIPSKTKGKVEKKLNTNHSIAVLPFKHIGETKADEHLQTGIADALTTKLSNLRQLTVRPTSAILQIKKDEPRQIGEELAVETILTGVIQQNDGRIRVTAQLINVKDGDTIWAEKFDISNQGIFDLQDNISEKVLQSLKVQMNADDSNKINKRYTENVEAYQAYSRGRYFWAMSSRNDLAKSIEYFQQAIKIDPNYALAYSGLADAQIFISSKNTGKSIALENQKLAKINALKALEIDDSLAEPHTTLAAIIFEESGDWGTAEKEFLKAIELNPNYSVGHNWYSLHLLAMGDFEKAEIELKKALEIDPVSPSMTSALGQIYYYQKKYDLAIAQYEKSLELDREFARTKVYLGLALLEVGQDERALSLFSEIDKIYPIHTVSKTALGSFYAKNGQEKEAQKILQILNNVEKPSVYENYGIAVINAHLGNIEKALDILESLSPYRNINMIVRIKFDPKLDLLRKEERFQKIVQQLP